MKQHVTQRSVREDRGNFVVSARIVIVKPDFAGIVRELRKFKKPTLWTLNDLLPVCGLANSDRVHLSRALRRAGIAPLRGKKLMLSLEASCIRAYVWHVGVGRVPDFKSDAELRRAYYKQHVPDLIAKIVAVQTHPGSPIARPEQLSRA